MHIIIIGCGRVGRTLAEKLNNDGNDVTVIDMLVGILKVFSVLALLMPATWKK